MMNNYGKLAENIDKVLVSEKELEEICQALAERIDKDMEKKGGKLLVVCVLKGSLVFTSDLIRRIKTPLKLDFIKASSYGGGTVSTGSLKISLDLSEKDLENTNVIIIEDIIDSGRTLKRLVAHIKDKGAKSVMTCALLDKPERREVEMEADYVGKVIPNHFVVGYGLDVDEEYRELPFVGVLKPEIIAKYIT